MPSSQPIPRSEYPRPDLTRDRWACLNGRWRFAVDAAGNGEALGWPARPDLGEEIVVPFAPESRLSGIARREFMPCVWYARRFTVPAAWRGRRLMLHFGAVDYEATVWVNGRCVGSHRGGYTPFACEITSAVAAGGNLLVVRAVDDPHSGLQASGKQSPQYHSHGCLYTRTTGIWQSVWLEPVGEAFIRSLRMIGDPAGGRIHVTAEIDGPAAGLSLAVEARAGRRLAGRGAAAAAGPAAACTVDLDPVRLWGPEDPFLYDLQISLTGPAGPVDTAASYFGLRSVQIDSPAVLLNGRAVFQRLVLDQGYYPRGLYTAPRDALLKRDIRLAMRLGFNGARLHQKVFEPRFLYWADRLGYLVWGEFADWGLDRTEGEALRRMAAEWTEAVRRDFNHPSIIGWCPLNETRGWSDPQALRDLYRLTRALDPTRPVIDSSGYDHYETDVFDCHNYEQDPEKFAAAFAPLARGGEPFVNSPPYQPYAGQPYVVSEYGGAGWDASAARGAGRKPGQDRRTAWGYGNAPRSRREFLDRYRRLTETLLRHPRIAGFCYTQLYDIEQEINGLLTYGRRMKFDPEAIAKINRQPAAIEGGR